jgi:hypothetical protein
MVQEMMTVPGSSLEETFRPQEILNSVIPDAVAKNREHDT